MESFSENLRGAGVEAGIPAICDGRLDIYSLSRPSLQPSGGADVQPQRDGAGANYGNLLVENS